MKIDVIVKEIRGCCISDESAKAAAKRILRLFRVMESDCEHEWLNHSFDQYGFLQEQICYKCGAKQSVP